MFKKLTVRNRLFRRQHRPTSHN